MATDVTITLSGEQGSGKTALMETLLVPEMEAVGCGVDRVEENVYLITIPDGLLRRLQEVAKG